MNFAAFNFVSTLPRGVVAAVAMLTALAMETRDARAAIATPQPGATEGQGEILDRPAGACGLGVVCCAESDAAEVAAKAPGRPGLFDSGVHTGGGRGAVAGLPDFYLPKKQNGRPVVTSPIAATAVSAAKHQEPSRA